MVVVVVVVDVVEVVVLNISISNMWNSSSGSGRSNIIGSGNRW